MVKHAKILNQKPNQLKTVVESCLNNNNESPVIQINNEPVVSNERKSISTENNLSGIKVEQIPIKSKFFDTDSSCSDSLSSNNSLNFIQQNDRKDIKESKGRKKINKKLSEEGQKHVAELIAYLHSDKPLIRQKVDFDEEDLELIAGIDKAIDFDKFFEPINKKLKDKLWIIPFQKSINENIIDQDISQNGFRAVNRFGEGVSDGCNISLSLATTGRNFDDVFKKTLEWTDIIEKADEALFKYENSGKRRSKMARRGSLLQPRFLFLSPHPELKYEKVLQSANCLPLREWTSELFLDSKESSELLDSETKRNLKWNASVEDFRHLLSPELSLFGNDIFSLLVQKRRRISQCPPRTGSQPMHFRRKSFNDGEIWSPSEQNIHKKNDYEEKLLVIRQNSFSDNRRISGASQQKSKEFNNLLLIPSETTFFENKTDLKRESKHSFELNSFTSLDSISPKVVANELTLITKELFLSVKNTEIITLLIRPHSTNVDTCPDLIALLGFHKRIIKLIASIILQESNVENCAQKIAYFIEVAEELKLMRNWYSVNSIILSLQSPPIARLRQCWQFLTNEYSDLYCEFIELSELIKREFDSLDYTPPSIPLFDDLIDYLKERCGSKYFEIKQHRFHCNWSKPETLANWVDSEIVDLENVAQDKRKIQKRVERINKDSHKEHNKGILHRMLHKSKSKDHSDSTSASSDSSSRTNSLTSSSQSRGSKQSFSSDAKLVKDNYFTRNSIDNGKHSKSVNPSCKNIWSIADMQKLHEHDEREILQEIARGLVFYQKNIMLYYFEDQHENARNFLLMQSYEDMDISMKRSLLLEPPRKIDKSPAISVENDTSVSKII